MRSFTVVLLAALALGGCRDYPLFTAPELAPDGHHHQAHFSLAAAGGLTITELGDSVHIDTPREPIPGTPGTPGYWGHPNNPVNPCPWGEGHPQRDRCVWVPGTPGTPGDSSFVRLTNLTPAVLRLTEAGWAVALAAGTGRVERARESGLDTIPVTVQPQTPPPPPPGEWDRVLADTTVIGDVVVPDGERWLVGPNVQVQGNVRTYAGTVAMRPGSSLQFLGADPDLYVGGGMRYGPEFGNDRGLWIGDNAALDIQCTPKESWNRTGSHPTWGPDDELWIAPTEIGDYEPRRWYPGQPIPQVHPLVPPAEVANVSRDCVIRGPGHIHIHSHHPQVIRYVRIEGMGVSNRAFGGPVLGRYALHMHHGHGGTAGTIIEGVAIVGALGRGYVPHESHGVTMRDNVLVGSWFEALWWDVEDQTNDLTVERLLVMGARRTPEARALGNPGVKEVRSVQMGAGTGNRMTGSVVAGTEHAGYAWDSEMEQRSQGIFSMWEFRDNVAHNNQREGLRFWFNTRAPHVTGAFTGYRNGSVERSQGGGFHSGPYGSPGVFSDMLLIDDSFVLKGSAQLTQEEYSAHRGTPFDLRPEYIHHDRLRVLARAGPALHVGPFALEPDIYTTFQDCLLQPAPGHPAVLIGSPIVPSNQTGSPIRFRRCETAPGQELTPADVAVHPDAWTRGGLGLSEILIERADRSGWRVTFNLVTRTKVVEPWGAP